MTKAVSLSETVNGSLRNFTKFVADDCSVCLKRAIQNLAERNGSAPLENSLRRLVPFLLVLTGRYIQHRRVIAFNEVFQ